MLARAHNGGGHVVRCLMLLDFGDIAEGWVLWAFSDSGEDLGGWVVEGWMGGGGVG
jgi:hypothetical protein